MSAGFNKSELQAVVISLVSAVVHYQEHIDTGEPADLAAAKGAIGANLLVRDWASSNRVLLPLRRDGVDPFGA